VVAAEAVLGVERRPGALGLHGQLRVDREQPVLEPHLHVPVVDAGEIRDHDERVLLLDDVDVGPEGRTGPRALALERLLLAGLERLLLLPLRERVSHLLSPFASSPASSP
jgi:hypothetical protein